MAEYDGEDIDAPFHAEAAGARAGINPHFGDWRQRFNFAPVPDGDGGAKKRAFEEQIRRQLEDIKWMYSQNVQLEITLHLDVQTILETSKTADLDNYAKSILDALKGPDGIMFDDTQVQTLMISWLDSYDTPYFIVSAKSSPDDFILKPVEFYEMPDGLWYPHSRFLWTDGTAEPATDLDHFAGLGITELMSSAAKRVRVQLRRLHNTRLKAFHGSKWLAPSTRGYHRSRIEGFALHTRKDWQSKRQEWRATSIDKARQLDTILGGMRGSYDDVIAALAVDKGNDVD